MTCQDKLFIYLFCLCNNFNVQKKQDAFEMY